MLLTLHIEDNDSRFSNLLSVVVLIVKPSGVVDVFLMIVVYRIQHHQYRNHDSFESQEHLNH